MLCVFVSPLCRQSANPPEVTTSTLGWLFFTPSTASMCPTGKGGEEGWKQQLAASSSNSSSKQQ